MATYTILISANNDTIKRLYSVPAISLMNAHATAIEEAEARGLEDVRIVSDTYTTATQGFAAYLRGKRIEIPVHYDMWMRGARFGEVRSVAKDGSYVKVKLDNAKRLLTVWRIDLSYIKIVY